MASQGLSDGPGIPSINDDALPFLLGRNHNRVWKKCPHIHVAMLVTVLVVRASPPQIGHPLDSPHG